jgi:hypothetical protein
MREETREEIYPLTIKYMLSADKSIPKIANELKMSQQRVRAIIKKHNLSRLRNLTPLLLKNYPHFCMSGNSTHSQVEFRALSLPSIC